MTFFSFPRSYGRLHFPFFSRWPTPHPWRSPTPLFGFLSLIPPTTHSYQCLPLILSLLSLPFHLFTSIFHLHYNSSVNTLESLSSYLGWRWKLTFLVAFSPSSSTLRPPLSHSLLIFFFLCSSDFSVWKWRGEASTCSVFNYPFGVAKFNFSHR